MHAHMAIDKEDRLRRRALEVRGKLSKKEAERLRREVEKLRKSWR